MPRKVIGAFCFFKDDMYLVINCSYCPIYIYIYIYCILDAHVCTCTMTGHGPTAVAMHEVPYGSNTDCGLVQMYVWCSACRTHEQTVLTQLYIHNHHNSDNSQIGILNSTE